MIRSTQVLFSLVLSAGLTLNVFSFCRAGDVRAGHAVKRGNGASGKTSPDVPEIIARMMNAYGGVEQWRNINGWSIFYTGLYNCKRPYDLRIYASLPDKFRLDFKYTEGKPDLFQIFCSGDRVEYLKNGVRLGDAGESAELQDMEHILAAARRRQAPGSPVDFYDDRGQYYFAGERTLGGRKHYVLEKKEPVQREKRRVFVDEETFFVTKREFDKIRGKFVELYIKGEPFRIGGLVYPSQRWAYHDGRLVDKLKVTFLSLDSPDDKVFDLP